MKSSQKYPVIDESPGFSSTPGTVSRAARIATTRAPLPAEAFCDDLHPKHP